MFTRIPLSRGKAYSLIDAADLTRVSRWSWSYTKNGTKEYAVRNDMGRRVYLHRFLLGAPKGMLVDHKNGNGLDNRRSNLRLADKSKNAVNGVKMRPIKSSKFRGVYWSKQSSLWVARIYIEGRRLALGCYKVEAEAGAAYKRAAKEHFKEFARE